MSEQNTVTLPTHRAVQILDILVAIPALDNAPTGNITIARNICAMKDALAPYQEARAKLIKKYCDKQPISQEDADKFNAAIEPIGEEEVIVTITTMKVGDLNLKENTIRPVDLSLLSVFLSDF